MHVHGLPDPRRSRAAFMATSAILAMCAPSGCGVQGGEAEPAVDLPSAGIISYLEDGGAPAAAEVGVDVRWPSAVGHAGVFHLYALARDAGAGITPEVRHWTSFDATTWSAKEPVLHAAADWEGGSLDAIGVTAHAGALWMTYTAGGGTGIGIARSEDGFSWHRLSDQPVLSAGALPQGAWEMAGSGPPFDSPSLTWADGSWWMAYLGDGGRGLGIARSEDGISWQRTSANEPSWDLSSPSGQTWDRDGMLSARLHADHSATGRRVWRLWYTGVRIAASGGLDTGIGFAASFDLQEWERAAVNPILRKGNFGEKEAAEVALPSGRGLVFSEFWKKDGRNRHILRFARQ